MINVATQIWRNKSFAATALHIGVVGFVQDVKDLLASGPVPPDSKACLEKYFAERE